MLYYKPLVFTSYNLFVYFSDMAEFPSTEKCPTSKRSCDVNKFDPEQSDPVHKKSYCPWIHRTIISEAR